MQAEHIVQAYASLAQYDMRQEGEYIDDKQMLSDRRYLSEHNSLYVEIKRKSTKKVPKSPIISRKTQFFR